ncbi:MAG TPA: dephospho-CoA kinase [bacterium]|nr:dephospho-CoA kinase [bacterium]
MTGGVASGKSTVASALRAHGAAIVDADAIAREVVRPGGPAYQAVVDTFGPSVVGPDGALDRKALGVQVFADPTARRRLNALTHPHIRRRMTEEAARLTAGDGPAVIVFDVPLLFDTTDGRDLDLDGTVVVYADRETQLRRLVGRDGLTVDEAQRRLDAQVRLEDKVKRADWVIDNSGTADATRAQVDRLWQTLKERARPSR